MWSGWWVKPFWGGWSSARVKTRLVDRSKRLPLLPVELGGVGWGERKENGQQRWRGCKKLFEAHDIMRARPQFPAFCCASLMLPVISTLIWYSVSLSNLVRRMSIVLRTVFPSSPSSVRRPASSPSSLHVGGRWSVVGGGLESHPDALSKAVGAAGEVVAARLRGVHVLLLTAHVPSKVCVELCGRELESSQSRCESTVLRLQHSRRR